MDPQRQGRRSGGRIFLLLQIRKVSCVLDGLSSFLWLYHLFLDFALFLWKLLFKVSAPRSESEALVLILDFFLCV